MQPMNVLRRAAAIAAALLLASDALAQSHPSAAPSAAAFAAASAKSLPDSEPIRVGLMLPATGAYASLGDMIEKGFRLHVAEQGGRLAGRSIRFFKVDDESDPAKATENVHKLIKRDQVDVLVGSVHSGVAMAMARAARESRTLLIVPNAGAAAITGSLCAKNIFRSSFSNWQPAYAMGKAAAQRGHKKAVTLTWQYAAGDESAKAFRDGFESSGGKVVQALTLPFPNMEFQALLTQIAAQKPDVVYAFFAGSGAVRLVKDYAAAGLQRRIPLVGPGFLTDGTLPAQGAAAEGMITTLHYADNLDTPRNAAFRLAFAKTYKQNADVYAVQGYDAAQMLAAGLRAAGGDVRRQDRVIAGIEAAEIDSPRGRFRLSRSHNPVQDQYLREVRGLQNEYRGIAAKALADPGTDCRM